MRRSFERAARLLTVSGTVLLVACQGSAPEAVAPAPSLAEPAGPPDPAIAATLEQVLATDLKKAEAFRVPIKEIFIG